MRPREVGRAAIRICFVRGLIQVIDMDHALFKLARTIDWGFLEQNSARGVRLRAPAAAAADRLMAGLRSQHTYNLSDEWCASCGSRTHIPSTFCGEEFSSTGCRSIAPR